MPNPSLIAMQEEEDNVAPAARGGQRCDRLVPCLGQDRKDELNTGAPPITTSDLTYILTSLLLEYESEGGHMGALHAKVQDAVDLFLEFRPRPRAGRFDDFIEVLGACTATAWGYAHRARAGGVNPAIVHKVVYDFQNWAKQFFATTVIDYEDAQLLA